ncbi:MAG: hypothetical protein ACFB2W_06945 [Leptolyngbyaceae cyanobacterium]
MQQPQNLSQLRQRLDELSIPGSTSQLGELQQLKQLWEQTYKPSTMTSYHPVIEDRLQLAERHHQ